MAAGAANGGARSGTPPLGDLASSQLEILDQLSDAVVMAALHERVLFVNPATEELLGW